MIGSTVLPPVSVETDTSRMVAYQTLAWGMVYPTADRLSGWQQWQALLESAFNQVALPPNEVLSALDLLPQNPANRLQTLQVEYTRLFINAVPQVLAPPYASAYTGSGLLMGRPAETALIAYRQAGLAFSPASHDLPDHLAAELEFMFYLTREALSAREQADDSRAELFKNRQYRFLKEHLLPWVPAWQKRVDEADRTGFYRALSRLIVAWLRIDIAYLANDGG